MSDTLVVIVVSRDETNKDNCLVKVMRRQIDLDTNEISRSCLSRDGNWILIEEGVVIPDECIYYAHFEQWVDISSKSGYVIVEGAPLVLSRRR